MVNIQLNLQNNHFQKAKKKKTRWHKFFFFCIFEEISSKKINFCEKKTKKRKDNLFLFMKIQKEVGYFKQKNH